MSLGLPDWQKMTNNAAPVMPAGQAQMTYFTVDVIVPAAIDTIDVYTVPAGKRLYLYFVDVGTAEDVMLLYYMRNTITTDSFGFWAAMHDTLTFPFGAGWVFEAGETLQAKIYNLGIANGTYNLNIFGVVVDA